MKNTFIILLVILALANCVHLHTKSKHQHALKHKSSQKPSLFSFMKTYRFKQSESTNAQIRRNKFGKSMNKFRFKTSIESGMGSTSQLHELNRLKEDGDIEGPIYHRSWAKFIEFNPSIVDQPDMKFFVNSNYHELQKKPHDEEDQDDFGYVEVPSEASFFFLLTKHGIHALSGRRNQLRSTVKSLMLSNIKPIYKTQKKGIQGGVEDLGNFAEGFCFKINASREGAEVSWIMCEESLAEKMEWMEILMHLKGQFTAFTKTKSLEGEAVIGSTSLTDSAQYKQTGPDGEDIKTDLDGSAPRQSDDGYWVPLQDWSTCTLKCGGGTMTLQQKCIPPVKDGKECSGEAVLTQPCNEEPCPPTPGKESSDEAETLPLKIKIMRVSQRPQIYETCVIKEGDLDIIREDLDQFVNPPRVPARVVLNNHTFSVFQSTEYDTILFTVELSQIGLKSYEDDESCFVAVNNAAGKNVVLCTLPTVEGGNLKAVRDDWIKQIGFFRDHCHHTLPVEEPDLDIANIKKGEYEAEEEEAKTSAVVSAGGPGAESEKKQGAVATLAVDAMAKEAKYERLAEKEELDREVMMELEDRKKIEMMKVADECLERDKRKAELEAKGSGAEAGAKKQCDEMKGEIKNMIMGQRSAASKKINLMRKMAEKKRRAAAGQIQGMRLKMAKEAMAAVKQGDIKKCDPARTKAEKTKYCNESFDTDPDLNTDCKDPEQYCQICCENEVGIKHKEVRAECFNKCDVGCEKTGNWVWVPEANAVKTF